MVTVNKNQKYAKIWIDIIKFLVEYSVSELINFGLLSTETFVYKKTFGTKQVAYFDKSNRNSSWIHHFSWHDFAHFSKRDVKTLLTLS